MLTDEHLAPVFRRAPPGVDETYDTLDNVSLGGNNSIEEFYKRLSAPLEGTVGAIILGESGLSDPSEGYWGRALQLSTGEHLQVRLHPRNSFERPLDDDEIRFVAIRRTSHGTVPHIGFGVFYRPRELHVTECTTPMTSGATIGCRGVHILLPSLFSKHDPHRDKDKGHAQLNLEGFHSIRPATLCLAVNRGGPKSDVAYSFTTGDAYMVMGAHMAGVDMPDPLQRSANNMTETDHSKQIAARQRRITKSIGDKKACNYVSSALTLCELLSAEGVLGIMCNSFFAGAFPDMMYSPCGVPLCISMAVHIACYPERFMLPPCTKQDTFANREMIRCFKSRWGKVMLDDFRAIDVAVKSGYDNARTQAGNSGEAQILYDNMKFWQRVGQRVITKVTSNPDDEIRGGSKKVNNTRFGVAELLTDPISDAKYAAFAQSGFLKPVVEAPINKIFMAPRADVRTTLHRVQDNTEAWLRTGQFKKHQISRANVNIATGSRSRKNRYPCKKCGTCFQCECSLVCASKTPSESLLDTSSSESDDDGDDIMDNKICMDAMESAAGAIAIAMLHGAYAMHQFQVKCFLFGDKCSNKCADCDADVSVLQGTLFTTKAGECRQCNRRRCYKCMIKVLRSVKPPNGGHCLRCMPGAPSDYKSLAQIATIRKKQPSSNK
tara:strand:- start:91 stop:2079 length:1989 start_codon:yes stop_codon:yes gene_type:complete